MYLFGQYLSLSELLVLFSGFVTIALIYLLVELKKIRKLEDRLERIERRLMEDIRVLEKKKKTR